jgi:maltose alpha-D-glucosyltransferase/alpha-amylase
MKRLIALRRSHPVFGHGDIHFLSPANPKVLAFLRRHEREQVLVVANLSRFTQPVELDLSEYAGAVPVEMFGNIRFPPVGEDGRYFLSLGPHSFFWFLLEPAAGDEQGPTGPDVRIDLSEDIVLDDPAFERVLMGRLPRLLPPKRWFVSKARAIRTARVLDRMPVPGQSEGDHEIHRRIFLVQLEFTEGEPDVYALPLSAIAGEDWPDAPGTDAGLFLRVVDGNDQRWVIQDGMLDPHFARLLLALALEGGELEGESLRLKGRRIAPPDQPLPDLADLLPKTPQAEQSNSNVIFDEALILKLYRRIGEAVNPELEVGEHLTRTRFASTAPLAGAIELLGKPRRTLAVVLNYVQNEGDAWQLFLDQAQRYYERLAAATPEELEALCLPGDRGCAGGELGPPDAVAGMIAETLELARRLGQRTAEMHAALADDSEDPAFAAEPYSVVYQRSLLQSMRNTTRSTIQALSSQIARLTGDAAAMARSLLEREGEVIDLFRELNSRTIRAARIRIHGDYHLGQVLWTGKDFLIIDFEGEPLRSVGERRLKRSPMRDVAGMVRSFDYAAWSGMLRHLELVSTQAQTAGRVAQSDRDIRGARIWSAWLAREFVRVYIERLRAVRPDLVSPSLADSELVLKTWTLEKALYEVRYELNSRPDWIEIPLRAVLELLDSPRPPPPARPSSGS